MNSDLPESTFRDPDQMYYWTQEWQNTEQATRADILAGRVTFLHGISEIEQHFEALSEQQRSRLGARKRQRRSRD